MTSLSPPTPTTTTENVGERAVALRAAFQPSVAVHMAVAGLELVGWVDLERVEGFRLEPIR